LALAIALRLFRSTFERVNWLKAALGTFCLKSVVPGMVPLSVARFGVL
jgi:hypothetical protein